MLLLTEQIYMVLFNFSVIKNEVPISKSSHVATTA